MGYFKKKLQKGGKAQKEKTPQKRIREINKSARRKVKSERFSDYENTDTRDIERGEMMVDRETYKPKEEGELNQISLEDRDSMLRALKDLKRKYLQQARGKYKGDMSGEPNDMDYDEEMISDYKDEVIDALNLNSYRKLVKVLNERDGQIEEHYLSPETQTNPFLQRVAEGGAFEFGGANYRVLSDEENIQRENPYFTQKILRNDPLKGKKAGELSQINYQDGTLDEVEISAPRYTGYEFDPSDSKYTNLNIPDYMKKQKGGKIKIYEKGGKLASKKIHDWYDKQPDFYKSSKNFILNNKQYTVK